MYRVDCTPPDPQADPTQAKRLEVGLGAGSRAMIPGAETAVVDPCEPVTETAWMLDAQEP
jgi:hypothetical protein